MPLLFHSMVRQNHYVKSVNLGVIFVNFDVTRTSDYSELYFFDIGLDIFVRLYVYASTVSFNACDDVIRTPL